LLADGTSFVLPAERWNAFVAMLDGYPRPVPVPGSAALLARPSVRDE
jgi:hypothetical protein